MADEIDIFLGQKPVDQSSQYGGGDEIDSFLGTQKPQKNMALRALGAVSKAVSGNENLLEQGLEGVAKAGRFANKGNQDLADLIAEKAGQYGGPVAGYLAATNIAAPLAIASEFLMPQDKLGAAMLPFAAAGEFAGPAAARNFGPAEVANVGEDAARGRAAQKARQAAASAQDLAKEAAAALRTRQAARAAAEVGEGMPGEDFEKAAADAIAAAKKARRGAQMAASRQAALAPQIQGGINVVKPGPASRAAGSMVSAATAVPERYASAVVADASILGSDTPSMVQVGKEYEAAFKKAGLSVTEPDWLKKITGSRFPPTDTQAAKLKNIVENAADKLGSNTLQEDEAFLARKAAAVLRREPKYAGAAAQYQDQFDNLLENSTLPNIRDLSRRYFRAAAKDQFESFLPRNKNMSPNALRAMIMGKQVIDAAGALAQGNPGQAAGKAIKAAAMSPLVVGQVIRGVDSALPTVNNIANPAMRAAGAMAASQLNKPFTLLSPKGQAIQAGPDEIDAFLQQGYRVQSLGGPR